MQKPIENIIPYGERLNAFSLRIGTRQGRPLLPPTLDILLLTPAGEVKPAKEIDGRWIGKKESGYYCR